MFEKRTDFLYKINLKYLIRKMDKQEEVDIDKIIGKLTEKSSKDNKLL
jgi:hypothetical protein